MPGEPLCRVALCCFARLVFRAALPLNSSAATLSKVSDVETQVLKSQILLADAMIPKRKLTPNHRLDSRRTAGRALPRTFPLISPSFQEPSAPAQDEGAARQGLSAGFAAWGNCCTGLRGTLKAQRVLSLNLGSGAWDARLEARFFAIPQHLLVCMHGLLRARSKGLRASIGFLCGGLRRRACDFGVPRMFL